MRHALVGAIFHFRGHLTPYRSKPIAPGQGRPTFPCHAEIKEHRGIRRSSRYTHARNTQYTAVLMTVSGTPTLANSIKVTLSPAFSFSAC